MGNPGGGNKTGSKAQQSECRRQGQPLKWDADEIFGQILFDSLMNLK